MTRQTDNVNMVTFQKLSVYEWLFCEYTIETSSPSLLNKIKLKDNCK